MLSVRYSVYGKKRVKQWRHQEGFKQRARRLPFRRAETPNEYKAKDWSNHPDLVIEMFFCFCFFFFVIEMFSGNNFFPDFSCTDGLRSWIRWFPECRSFWAFSIIWWKSRIILFMKCDWRLLSWSESNLSQKNIFKINIANSYIV